VVGSAGDLVADGLVASLAKPGGNVTGSTNISPDVGGKRLELLKEALPRASHVAVLRHPGTGSRHEEVEQTDIAARSLGVTIHPVEVKNASEFQNAYAAMIKKQANAVVIIQHTFSYLIDGRLWS
jgi:putative ABC transport system substrate-binding protein